MSETPRPLESPATLQDLYAAELKENPRQQRKLARALFAKTPQEAVFVLEQIEAPSFNEGEKRELLEGLRRGGLHGKSLEDVRLPAVFQEIDRLFPSEERGRSPSEALVRLQARVKAAGLEPIRLLLSHYMSPHVTFQEGAPSFEKFMETCSTPVDFFDLVQRHLQHMQRERPEMLPQIIKEVHRLQACLYGKKSEYWDQYLLLQRKAFRYPVEEPPLNFPHPMQMEAQERARILANTSIKGGVIDGTVLTTAELSRNNLAPAFKVSIENKAFYFSQAFTAEDRIVVIGYTPINEKPGTYEARSYYLSSSQSVWRYLPMVNRNDAGNVNGFYKSSDEHDLTLSLSLQSALAEVFEKSNLSLPAKQAERAFYGTTCDDQEERGQEEKVWLRAFQHKGHDYVRGHIGQHHRKNAFTPGKFQPEPLGLLDLSEKPQLDQPVKTWKVQNPLYGEVTHEVFHSKNNRLSYLFCHDTRGRAWIAHIENRSGLSSFGGKEYCVTSGDLATPAYEYANQTEGYENEDLSSGKYVDVFKNYHAHIDLIKEYVASFKARERTPSPFAKATDFSTLLTSVRKLPGLQGSTQFYPSSVLEEQIRAVWHAVTLPGATRERLEQAASVITNTQQLRLHVLRIAQTFLR